MTPNNNRVMACVLDTECTYISKSPNMVFHFGGVFGDITQNHSLHTIEMDYYVLEILEQIDLFLHTNKKGENYAVNPAMRNAWKDALRNPHKVRKWKHIIEEFNDNINSMGIDYLTSYNFNFDIGQGDKVGTIRKTHQQLTDKIFYLPRKVEYFCLMDIVATCMANRNFYSWVKTLDEEELEQITTVKGNLSFSAETMLRFLSKDLYYVEQHTALRDARMEFRLLMECWRKWDKEIRKHFVNNVKSVSWQNHNKGLSMKEKLLKRGGRK